MHPGWDRLARFPPHVVPCPRCSSPQRVDARLWRWDDHGEQWVSLDHNWRWDEDAGSWLCRRPSCKTRGQTNHTPIYWLRPRG